MRTASAPATKFYQAQIEHTSTRIAYWNDFVRRPGIWEPTRRYYHRRLSEIYRTLIPPGLRVLELGCGCGDLLDALRPSYGLGVDFSEAAIEIATSKYPHLEFLETDVHDFESAEEFDVIICSDLVNELWDVQRVLSHARRLSHRGTRIILNTYSRLWEIPRRVAEKVKLAQPLMPQNWLTVEDLSNLLYLADFEVIRASCEIMWPLGTPLWDRFCNRYLVKLWPFRWFGITNFVVARPRPQPVHPDPVVSVVVPARNEAGNVPTIFDRLPEMGAGTELIFVEGHSSDNTFEAIEREIEKRRRPRTKLFRQTGKGKGDAVRMGFANASGDVLVILDADLTVPPEDLPRFYEAWRSGQGEFINGVRFGLSDAGTRDAFLQHGGQQVF